MPNTACHTDMQSLSRVHCRVCSSGPSKAGLSSGAKLQQLVCQLCALVWHPEQLHQNPTATALANQSTNLCANCQYGYIALSHVMDMLLRRVSMMIDPLLPIACPAIVEAFKLYHNMQGQQSQWTYLTCSLQTDSAAASGPFGFQEVLAHRPAGSRKECPHARQATYNVYMTCILSEPDRRCGHRTNLWK